VRCPSCGARGAPDARFCDRCGTALPETTADLAGPSPADGDRRIVTALFADLVDYVRMLAEHDPEVVRTRVTAALATMADSIERLGGTREKFIGDAVFAVFGWPTAHDDDAVRAALAGLSIRAALQDPSAGDPSMPSGEPLEVRIGIATGEVVAGRRSRGADGDLGLTGEAITTAARIQSLAKAGEILLDGATVRAARGRLATEPRGTVVLRGQSTPVELLALLGEAGMTAWTPYRAGASGPLVGRERESDVLREAIERCARTGIGTTIVVAGEAGMGKTRLLETAGPIARAAGFAWTWTECVSYGRGEPYRWARLLAQTVADEQGVDSGSLARRFLFDPDMDAQTARRFGGAVAAIARDAAFSGWEDEASHMLTDPAEVASALMEVAVRYLDRMLTELGPRVVVIDDLHWLDGSSEGMVELLVEASTRAPLVLLAGTRPDRMERWLERPGVTRLDLTGLDEPETARLATLVARAAVEVDDARRIHERTAGNPLFVGETVRAYLEDGTLERRDGRVALAEIDPAQVPLTLRAVLGARIDALEPDARAALEVAAVIGIWFRRTLVESLLAQEGTRATEATWARLAASAMALPADGDAWRFAHALIHDAAYAGMLASRRRRLHEQVADHLSTRPGSAAPGHIAMHRAAAGDVARALPLLREAAASAMHLGAADESARLWRRAAELAEPVDPVAAAADREQAQAALIAARSLREAAGLEGR
jgi:adenylate cyclase